MAAAATPDRGTREKVLDLIDMSAALVEKAGAVLGRHEQVEKQAAELIPTAVDELLRARLIEPEEKQAAADALKDPARTLQILIKTARAKQADNAISLGQPSGPEKRASAGPGPFAGRRRGEQEEEPESYRVFRQHFAGGN